MPVLMGYIKEYMGVLQARGRGRGGGTDPPIGAGPSTSTSRMMVVDVGAGIEDVRESSLERREGLRGANDKGKGKEREREASSGECVRIARGVRVVEE